MTKTKKLLILSSLIILAFSFIGSLGLYILQIGNFFGNFLVLTTFQFILFSFLGQVFKNLILKNIREKELKKLEGLSTILECSYCGGKNLLIFNPNDVDRIEFECDHCHKKNLVTMQFQVSQVFEPMEIPKVIGIPSKNG